MPTMDPILRSALNEFNAAWQEIPLTQRATAMCALRNIGRLLSSRDQVRAESIRFTAELLMSNKLEFHE